MDIEPLLKPITPDAPCGEDLSYDTAFNDLEGLARGKEAQQFSGSDNP
jgi:type VI secretion system protein ImpA